MSATRFLYRIVQKSHASIATATTTKPALSPNKSPSSSPRTKSSETHVHETPSDCQPGGTGEHCNTPDPESTDASEYDKEPATKRLKLDDCSHNNNKLSALTESEDGSASKPDDTDTRKLHGVIFDMDGTLTVPVLNFVEMRRELEIPVGSDILTTVLSMPPEEKDKAMKIIEKWEEEGAKKLQLQPGTMELLEFVAESRLRRALMTRNSMVQTRVFLDRIQQQLNENPEKYPHLSKEGVFEEVLTRDFRPVKPDPAPVIHLCKCFDLEPWQVLVIGDDVIDVLCGKRAGAGVTVILNNERNKTQERHEDFRVESLTELLPLFTSPISVYRQHQ